MSGWLGLWRAATAICALLMSGGAFAQQRPADHCRLDIASRYVGAHAVAAVRSAVRDVARHRPVRWITPGRTIRPDFNPRRLNVILDETGRIMNMRCG